jgi:hypothetical protein
MDKPPTKTGQRVDQQEAKIPDDMSPEEKRATAVARRLMSEMRQKEKQSKEDSLQKESWKLAKR